MKNKAITSRDVDFAKWYTDIVREAHLADYSGVKGCIVFEPNGYAIWEKMQKVLDEKFKALGHQNVYLPLLIPESLMRKESELIEGFAPEGAWVTEGGKNKLEERMIIRPTSETLFSDYYASIVKSYKDLPLLYNQWCNVMRWEKETRPFLRTREFLWQEGHTVHASEEEAKAFAQTSPEEAINDLGNRCEVAVVKLGAQGAMIRRGGETVRVDAMEVQKVVDTTAAGDFFAAGFMYGYLQGASLEKCGRIGSILAGHVIQTVGTVLPEETWHEIKLNVNTILSE